MEVTQSYARPSAASMQNDGMRMEVSTEQSRPPVFLEALVKDSLAYARQMLALYAVVSGDYRSRPKDHTAYQLWVQERYMEELRPEQIARQLRQPALQERRDRVSKRVDELSTQQRKLEQIATGALFETAKRRYFKWLYTNNFAAWLVLDPVVSVHPDCLIFEVFSVDESSYGRVTVPIDRLEIFGEAVYGTTNIDFSRVLADEFERVRSYRPAWLQIGSSGVTVATSAGEALEKKIDLPPSWVRGFLQVQSAAAFPATELTLSAETVAEVLALLQRQKESQGPRSLRFQLAPGEKPSVIIEPWGITITEATHSYTGSYRGDIRIWGRRRLSALTSLLPHADRVQVRLLGTGMPSYWSVFQKDHRFDLGLSGWTNNDWSQASRFDLLAATSVPSESDVKKAATTLEQRLHLSPTGLAALTQLTRDAATAALQRCCAEGRAMYDPTTGEYRWRPLLPFPAPKEEGKDSHMAQARRLIATNGVRWLASSGGDTEGMIPTHTSESTERVRARVKVEKSYDVTLDLDLDGRVQFAHCTCGFFQHNKLRKGPCGHILAVSALAPAQVAALIAQRNAAATPAQPTSTAPQFTIDPNRFKGMTFVFTGALTLFTREEAESLTKQSGGTATGSVSRNTTYLVAGERAGSKLARARELGISVLTETQFLAMLEGK